MGHESLQRERHVEGSSNRSFGIVFAVVFAIIALFPVLFGGALRWWSVVIALVFVALALLAPTTLAPLNRIWMRFGLLLHKIVSPIVLGIMFFLVVTPIGLLMRVAGKDPLRLRLDKSARTYWIDRTPPGPKPESLTDQF